MSNCESLRPKKMHREHGTFAGLALDLDDDAVRFHGLFHDGQGAHRARPAYESGKLGLAEISSSGGGA